ncbi:MSMEG_0569 family flavin-dependent oxidoreductase [Granulosicoccus antarcticus]|uniref:Putative oxidoreductase CzcO n=1 Tax=Granulosicoccus antarcticus IMCC3135 TaxID=1192854 RepID=A0A2Z2NUS8_9GAMM|nr:MSMEG_0569 family flavin-dependent oxidoreductase [Granulosicoccus antarcticus]ASJ73771.1 putative oxidoreductase CzcO [Granulosicoccus antarcticus IMCC3135]
MKTHYIPVVIVGGSQAGLAASYCLQQRGIEHIVFERNTVANAWRDMRWNTFCLVTPNWQCTLPGFSYTEEYGGSDPDGFMLRDEIISYIEAYRAYFNPPLHEHTPVHSVTSHEAGFEVLAGDQRYLAADVIVATGAYHLPKLPGLSADLPTHVLQLHSSTYKDPAQLPPGDVLVVGSGQSGCQIAEDLHLAGRRVHLALGSAPRAPRRHRGRDVTAWLVDMGHYDITVDDHPQGEAVRHKTNHYMTGRDGGRDIDLRRFALEGMQLHGRLQAVTEDQIEFDDTMLANLDAADASAERIKQEIDKWIAANDIHAPDAEPWFACHQPEGGNSCISLGFDEPQNLAAVIWATGFTSDYPWLEVAAFDEKQQIDHWRGGSRQVDGLWVLGLPWMVTWGSGRFSGVGRDAQYVATRISERNHQPQASSL